MSNPDPLLNSRFHAATCAIRKCITSLRARRMTILQRLCWCTRTHENFGPDGQPVSKQECCAGRACYGG